MFDHFEFETTELFNTTLWVLDELKTSSNFPQKLGTLDDLEIPFKAMLVFTTPYFAVSAGYFLLLLPLLLSHGKHGTLSSAWGHPRAHRMHCHDPEHMASPVGCAFELEHQYLCTIIPLAQLLTRAASCWVVLVACASNRAATDAAAADAILHP